MVVVAAIVLLEAESKNFLCESCPGIVPDLVGLVHGSGDVCFSGKNL